MIRLEERKTSLKMVVLFSFQPPRGVLIELRQLAQSNLGKLFQAGKRHENT